MANVAVAVTAIVTTAMVAVAVTVIVITAIVAVAAATLVTMAMVAVAVARKKQPIDYRRSGVITLFVGIGLFLFGVFFLGSILKGVGALVTAIGVGQIIAGYLYPNTSEELTNAVEDFEKK